MPAFTTDARNRPEAWKPGSITSGGIQRQLKEASASYRDEYHMDKSLGAALTPGASKQIADNRKKFGEYVNTRTGEINTSAATIQPQYDKAFAELTKANKEALDKIGGYKDIDQEYNKWASAATQFTLMTGDDPNRPGKEESRISIPNPYAVPFATALAKNTYKVIDNKIYLHGRGQEVYDAYNDTIKIAKDSFYNAQAKPISEYNSSVNQAKSTVSTQYNDALSKLNVEKGVAEGQVSTARAGLELEQKEQSEALASIRTSYQDRLSRINEALSMNVQRKAPSASPKQQPQQAAQPQTQK